MTSAFTQSRGKMNQISSRIQDDPEFHGTDIGVRRVKNTILALEQLENDLFEVAREAIGGPIRIGSVTITEADLRLLEVARQPYRDSDFGLREMIDYLSTFAEFESIWIRVSRSVIRVFDATCDARLQSWHIWTEQFHRAGTMAWHEGVPACYTIQTALQRHQPSMYPENWNRAFQSICQRLRVLDDIMDRIYPRILPDSPRREHYEDEFRDTGCAYFVLPVSAAKTLTRRFRLAVQAINEAEGADPPLTTEKIVRFKAIVRANRLAAQVRLNTVDTTVSPSAVSTSVESSALSASLSRRVRNTAGRGSSTTSATTDTVSGGDSGDTLSTVAAKKADSAKACTWTLRFTIFWLTY